MTENFSISEFRCSCGCDMPAHVVENLYNLVHELQKLRDIFCRQIKINSGYRCEKHNESIGGVKNSQHVLGKAADIVVEGFTPLEVYEMIIDLNKQKFIRIGGLGLYDNFVHVDTRINLTKWDYRKQ